MAWGVGVKGEWIDEDYTVKWYTSGFLKYDYPVLHFEYFYPHMISKMKVGVEGGVGNDRKFLPRSDQEDDGGGRRWGWKW